MSSYIIEGGKKLRGEVSVSGSKNASLPIIASTILNGGTTKLYNIPDIRDTRITLEILKYLGCKVKKSHGKIEINTKNMSDKEIPEHLMSQMRSTVVLAGAILGRFKEATFSYPGGCDIGARPIDLHLSAFKKMGINIEENYGFITCKCDKIISTDINLDFPSVGATENIILAATFAEGTTKITNAAMEPEIVDLANFLNEMGANVKGAGTNTIKIKGVKELIGTEHNVIPDRIEAATYMVAAAMTKGDITIENVIMDHLKPVTAKLIEAGCEIIEMENAVRVIGPEVLKPIDIKTLPHPGFPTDVQAQFMAMLTVANGSGTVIETVFENRFMHVAEFNRMGADIKIEGRSAIVKGVNQLYGAKVNATDLRAGAALILCGLIAEGETQIGEIYHIQRGYVDIDKKITALGGNIQIIED